MNDREAFTKLVKTLSPWAHQLVFVGGWAHRLYRLHPQSVVPSYQPLATLDADVAFAQNEQFDGSIKAPLHEAGFQEELTGNHRPPVSQYTLGNGEANGFYAEFLTPLIGRAIARDGTPIATLTRADVTAQRLRYLELLLRSPWSVTLDANWGADPRIDLRIPNPVSFIVQKLLIQDDRLPDKKAQDVLYIHDTIEMFADDLDGLAKIWKDEIRASLHENWVRNLNQTIDRTFGILSDLVRNAAAIPQDRELDPERMRAMCQAALLEMLT